MEKKKKIYEKWWFWVIALVFLVLMCLGVGLYLEKNTDSTETKEVAQASKNMNNTDNKSVNYEYVDSIINNDSKEKIDKIVVDKNITSNEMEEIYHIREKGNEEYDKYTIWFFSSKNNAKEFDTYELGETTRDENGLLRKTNIREEQEKQELEEKKQKEQEEQKQREAEEKIKKEQEEQEFKNNCKIVEYEDLARNPDKIKGQNVKITGEVIQVMKDYTTTNIRVNITKSDYDFYTDTVYITYTPEAGEDKILEDDIITIWGTSQGDCTYTTVLGATVTLPLIEAKYIELQE